MKKLYFKNFITFFIIFLFLISLSITAYAHAGKTDEYGGHFDGETGEYHYHHGYPAHQHENGICPYDYDDNADHSSGSHSSGSTNGEYTTVEHQSTTSHYRHPNSQSDSSDIEYHNDNIEKVLIILSAIIVLFDFIVFTIFWKKECSEENSLEDFFEYVKAIFWAYLLAMMLSMPVVIIGGIIGAIIDFQIIFEIDTDILTIFLPFYTGFMFIIVVGIVKTFNFINSKLKK